MTLTTRHWDRLGNGGLSFTELGFGAAPMANLYRPVTEAEADAKNGWERYDAGSLLTPSESVLNELAKPRGRPRKELAA